MKRARNVSGFTIVEIVIAVLIIGVLTAILVPVLISRLGEARVAAAGRDLEMITDAEERVAIDTGFYLRLYALDDVRGGDSIPLGDDTDVVDGFGDERINDIFSVASPMRLFIRVEPNIDPIENGLMIDSKVVAIFDALTSASATAQHRWNGPYFTIRSDETLAQYKAAFAVDPAATRLHNYDIPNDPWGTDYLLFTRSGIVLEPDGIVAAGLDIDGTTYPALNLFDKPTVLSLGPDGLPGSVGNRIFGKGDDIVRGFGY